MKFFGAPPGAAPAPDDPDGGKYERKKKRESERQRKQSASVRELAPLPTVVDPERKAQALDSLAFFLKTYFPKRFRLEWSTDHLIAIEDFERIVRNGGQKALAMPRGSGKTAIAECAALWAVLRGSRKFVMLVGATSDKAKKTLQNLKTQLTTNELLHEDWPEVTAPIRGLQGITQRRLLFNGNPVTQSFTQEQVILPDIPGSAAASAIIQTAGLTGSIRGATHDRPDGVLARPDLAVLDDPQTDESADSPTQCADRLDLINGAVLGLAGPDEKIAAMALVTVIKNGDMADTLLDSELSPEWQGQRTKLIYEFPTRMDLWDRYAKVRAEGFVRKDGGKAGNEFYIQNREAMDEGAVLGWPARKFADDVSAVQHVMNLRLRDLRKFQAEYQNDPVDSAKVDTELATAEEIRERLNQCPRGSVPPDTEALTAHIDIQQNSLWWLVAGWRNGFGGGVVDYNCFPEQDRDYFGKYNIKVTLAEKYPTLGLEGAIYKALTEVVELLAGKEWSGTNGLPGQRVRRIMIDEGFQKEVVYRFCRESKYAAILTPAKGKGIKSTVKPMDEWKVTRPDVLGQNCVIYSPRPKSPVRHVLVDTNAWKSLIQSRLATAMGSRGALSLFGSDSRIHRMLADHLTSEGRKTPEYQGRRVDEWALKPDRDNEWLDNLIGSAVGASIEGVTLLEASTLPKARKRRRGGVSYPDQQDWSTTL